MSAVSENIVREFFELRGFFVRQERKFISPLREENEEIDFFVVNPSPTPGGKPIPFLPEPADLARVERALVVVIGGHAEVLSPAMLADDPRISRLVTPAALQRAAGFFPGGGGVATRILVVPSLPQNEDSRQQIADRLKGLGVDVVIPFRTLLADLMDQVEVNRNYQKSDLLQLLRILKTHDFVKEKQLELFKARRPQGKKAKPSPPKSS